MFFAFPRNFVHQAGLLHGHIDVIRPFRTGCARPALHIVGTNDCMTIHGWALSADSRPARAVIVTIDGTLGVPAVMGVLRQDIVAVHGQQALQCGFRAVVPLRDVEPGPHAISVNAVGDGDVFSTIFEQRVLVADPALGPVVATVTADRVRRSEDEATPAAATVTVAFGTLVDVEGWALLPGDVVPDGVAVIVDGRYVFEGETGLSRDDVARELKRADDRVGYRARIPSELVGLGGHRIAARAFRGDGVSFDSATAVEIFVDEVGA